MADILATLKKYQQLIQEEYSDNYWVNSPNSFFFMYLVKTSLKRHKNGCNPSPQDVNLTMAHFTK